MPSKIDPSRFLGDQPVSRRDLAEAMETIRRELGHGGWYKLDAPGAVERPVADKLGDVVSVKDFGAVGDGETDDTEAIQRAIDALEDRGGVIDIPVGIYLTTRSLVLSEGTMLRGTSAWAGTYGMETKFGSAIRAVPSANWRDGDSLVQFVKRRTTDDDDSAAAGSMFLTFRGVGTTQRPVVHGVSTQGMRDFIFVGNTFSRNSGNGLLIVSNYAHRAYGNRSFIAFNRAIYNGQRGIYHTGADSTFLSNDCGQNQHHGLHVVATSSIVGGQYWNNGASGLYMGGKESCASGVACHDNGWSGPIIEGDRNAVFGAATYGNGQRDIGAGRSAGVFIQAGSGNVVSAVTSRSIGDNKQYHQRFGVYSDVDAAVDLVSGDAVNDLVFFSQGKKRIMDISHIPTSPEHLPSGSLWIDPNDGNVLRRT